MRFNSQFGYCVHHEEKTEHAVNFSAIKFNQF